MKIIKLPLISIIALFLVVTTISLFIPSHVRISRATDIVTTTDSIWKQINDMHNWKNWYPAFQNNDSGNVFLPDSVNGRLTVLRMQKGSITLGTLNDNHLTAHAELPTRNIEMGWNIITTPASGSLTIQWYMDFHLRWYPWEKFSSLMFEKIYGSQMEQGLSNLKKYLEK